MQAQGRGAAAAAPPARGRARPIDLTGYWVAVISEDWRWRMVTPARGDYASIPLNVAGKNLADTWDPAKDEAAGEQCKSYGAPGLMRGPTRLRITWLDDTTLKLETDYGMQTRLLQFRAARTAASAAPSLQGVTTAQWVMAGGGRGRGGAPQRGSMKSMTTRLRPGYLRKNGVPYSANTVFTEYWDVRPRAGRQPVAGRHQYGGRPGEPADPVGDVGALQERTGRREVGPDAELERTQRVYADSAALKPRTRRTDTAPSLAQIPDSATVFPSVLSLQLRVGAGLIEPPPTPIHPQQYRPHASGAL